MTQQLEQAAQEMFLQVGEQLDSIKNNVLGMIKWEQLVFGGNPQFGVQLQPIDFAGYAVNCGAAGYTIEHPEEAESVLRDALAHPGPAVVQAVVDPTEPPHAGQDYY